MRSERTDGVSANAPLLSSRLTFTTVTTPDEVAEILALQAANLPQNLSPDTMAAQGFVTVQHDPAVLNQMNQAAPAAIAKADGRVVAYALAMPREFAAGVPVLRPMFELLDGLSWQGAALATSDRWFVMGQICVAAAYRGLGIVEGLYRTMKEVYASRFDFVVTEVSLRNTRSLRVHERVGFHTLHTYRDEINGETWRILVLDFSSR
jgi:ribosomal protein S18 acetylase RimI-like enzyme